MKGLQYRGEVVWSFAALALLFLLPLFVGCGGDEGTGATAKVQRTRERTAQLPPPVTLPPEAPPVTTREEQTLEPVVVEPEPPREVTYGEAESVFLERRYDEAKPLLQRWIGIKERRNEAMDASFADGVDEAADLVQDDRGPSLDAGKALAVDDDVGPADRCLGDADADFAGTGLADRLLGRRQWRSDRQHWERLDRG